MYASRGACADSRSHAVAYDLGGVRPQRTRRKVDGRACQRESCGRSHTRLLEEEPRATVASRAFARVALEPRPVGTTLECVSLWLATPTRRGQSGRREPVARRRRMRRVCVCSKRRWHDHLPASQTGQGGAVSCSAGNRRSPPLPRPEQLRVEGSPLSRGRRDHCRSVTADYAPLHVARPPRRAAAR